MKASWYAEALAGALVGKNEKEAEKVVARFYEVIKAHGHTGLLPFIPAELEKIEARAQAHREATLVTADAKSRTKWSHAYDHYYRETLLPLDATRKDVIDETIIGGYQIRTKDLLVDSSYKRSLIELYQKITN
ncbi:MAG: hypothetical protein A2937_03815 [Candidatus Yonathbacteria bacterium RIFCSPLOWO2_01_FULL_47_33b]|uniref:Uncharacterized protein n=1 Tax=Candidatus Yonathbacteria bacterium RIFCSPLOWO2_01_FULL_47_33b TaxID=1802727 RepID=A0A1G2SFJ4_9BACT|nr:MAG: hypothetical protein A2937_03815 [Candidatus Yonathbacteria bacterium RIFCSPLOWO2_01_FULL_47_33b]